MTNELSKTLSKHLGNHIPAKAIPQIVDWMIQYGVNLTVTPPRKSKAGDYRAPSRGKGHRISVNVDLNQYAFLVTLIHEFAHLLTFNEFAHRVKPHGPEWKNHYKKAMDYFLGKDIFPADVELAIKYYMLDPAAATCRDDTLYKALKQYDPEQEKDPNIKILYTLPKGQKFRFKDDFKIFIKGDLRRTRFLCQEINSGRQYTVGKNAEVYPVRSDALEVREALQNKKQLSKFEGEMNDLRKQLGLPHDDLNATIYMLGDLAEGQVFRLANNPRVFKKGKLRRTRFICEEISTGRLVTISGKAKVILVGD